MQSSGCLRCRSCLGVLGWDLCRFPSQTSPSCGLQRSSCECEQTECYWVPWCFPGSAAETLVLWFAALTAVILLLVVCCWQRDYFAIVNTVNIKYHKYSQIWSSTIFKLLLYDSYSFHFIFHILILMLLPCYRIQFIISESTGASRYLYKQATEGWHWWVVALYQPGITPLESGRTCTAGVRGKPRP